MSRLGWTTGRTAALPPSAMIRSSATPNTPMASSAMLRPSNRLKMWKVKRSASTNSRARSIAGISVSIVVLELGTICPMR